jgi:hypothetical protein
MSFVLKDSVSLWHSNSIKCIVFPDRNSGKMTSSHPEYLCRIYEIVEFIYYWKVCSEFKTNWKSEVQKHRRTPHIHFQKLLSDNRDLIGKTDNYTHAVTDSSHYNGSQLIDVYYVIYIMSQSSTSQKNIIIGRRVIIFRAVYESL